MKNETITVKLTPRQRDWLIEVIRDHLNYEDDWEGGFSLAEADVLRDLLLATKGLHRFKVRVRSDMSVPVEAADETAARQAAMAELNHTGGPYWHVEAVEPQAKT
jgi:hypothetical protein